MAGGHKGSMSQAMSSAGRAALVALLNLVFLPHQTLLAVDAIVRSLVRRFITGERLLEWETAAESESQSPRRTPVDRYLSLMPLVTMCVAIVVLPVRAQQQSHSHRRTHPAPLGIGERSHHLAQCAASRTESTPQPHG